MAYFSPRGRQGASPAAIAIPGAMMGGLGLLALILGKSKDKDEAMKQAKSEQDMLFAKARADALGRQLMSSQSSSGFYPQQGPTIGDTMPTPSKDALRAQFYMDQGQSPQQAHLNSILDSIPSSNAPIPGEPGGSPSPRMNAGVVGMKKQKPIPNTPLNTAQQSAPIPSADHSAPAQYYDPNSQIPSWDEYVNNKLEAGVWNPPPPIPPIAVMPYGLPGQVWSNDSAKAGYNPFTGRPYVGQGY